MRFEEALTLSHLAAMLTSTCTNHYPLLQSAWRRLPHPNLHFSWYEDLKTDLPAQLAALSVFLGRSSWSEDELSRLAEHVGIENMRKVNRGCQMV